MGVLTVYLDKITNLRDADFVGRSDPYVKFELEQDNFIFDKGYGEQKSTVKKNTCNPEYGETFTFGDVPTMNNMCLFVKVYDQDVGLDDEIGKAKINLERMNLTAQPQEVVTVVDPKKGGGWFSRKAQIHLKVSYTE